MILPVTMKVQPDDLRSVEIQSRAVGRDCRVVCNHIMTRSTRRVMPCKTAGGSIPRIDDTVFQEVKKRAYAHLPERRLFAQ